MALVAPLPGAPLPTAEVVRRCVDDLGDRGVRRVVTGALAPPEREPFERAGFELRERLHLLAHDLVDVPRASAPGHRRGRRGDRVDVLALDRLAFDEFWWLDAPGLDDAIRATPAARFRVVAGEAIHAYAITGRSGRRGYLQRLAVHPRHRHQGLGAGLAADGLRWLRRHGAAQALVNTQHGNSGALALYERLGFRHLPHGLVVLSRDVGGSR